MIDLSTQKQRKKGMGALSLPRWERTPLSATGAEVPFASDPTTLRLRFRSCKVRRCSPNFWRAFALTGGSVERAALRKWPSPGDCISRNGGMSRILEGWRVTGFVDAGGGKGWRDSGLRGSVTADGLARPELLQRDYAILTSRGEMARRNHDRGAAGR